MKSSTRPPPTSQFASSLWFGLGSWHLLLTKDFRRSKPALAGVSPNIRGVRSICRLGKASAKRPKGSLPPTYAVISNSKRPLGEVVDAFRVLTMGSKFRPWKRQPRQRKDSRGGLATRRNFIKDSADMKPSWSVSFLSPHLPPCTNVPVRSSKRSCSSALYLRRSSRLVPKTGSPEPWNWSTRSTLKRCSKDSPMALLMLQCSCTRLACCCFRLQSNCNFSVVLATACNSVRPFSLASSTFRTLLSGSPASSSLAFSGL
mmetsp:Transcript_96962/g.224765  ORF Transcript_96962/g.224765 Transcript_96962/m.224765 type:complete len:259 (-) Transcript_96962:203-979(-)